MIQCLTTGHFHFLENVVVAAADQNTGFLNAQISNQTEVLLAGTNPAGDLREFQIQLHTLFNGISILLTVDEELCLPDDAVRAAQLGQQLINVDDLLHAVGLHRLLTVPERGIGNPNFLRHIHRHTAVVEGNLRHGAVSVDIPLQIGLSHILQRILIRLLLQ